eukprot:scaffold2859_cov126-Ochromonas_danica.AAC.1
MLGVLTVSDQEDEARRQERKERSEDKFKLNLKRLSGLTSAVTIDDMCEVMAYIQNNGVHDLSFVEEPYRASIFSDDEFLEKTAVQRDSHRVARKFLEDAGIKDRIRDYDRINDQRNLYKDFCDLLLMSVRFARRHLRNPATSYLVDQFIPQMSGLANTMNPFLISNTPTAKSPLPPSVEDAKKGDKEEDEEDKKKDK